MVRASSSVAIVGRPPTLAYPGDMAVSGEDRRRWERQVAHLREIENDDEGTPEWQQSVHDAANRWRARHGISPLREWWEDESEIEFYERARALGLLRRVH